MVADCTVKIVGCAETFDGVKIGFAPDPAGTGIMLALDSDDTACG